MPSILLVCDASLLLEGAQSRPDRRITGGSGMPSMTSPTDALPRWNRRSMICRSRRLKPLSSSSCVMEVIKGGGREPEQLDCCNSSTC